VIFWKCWFSSERSPPPKMFDQFARSSFTPVLVASSIPSLFHSLWFFYGPGIIGSLVLAMLAFVVARPMSFRFECYSEIKRVQFRFLSWGRWIFRISLPVSIFLRALDRSWRFASHFFARFWHSNPTSFPIAFLGLIPIAHRRVNKILRFGSPGELFKRSLFP
jgi:hypothetical protein